MTKELKTVALIVVPDYERVNGCKDVCRKSCDELFPVRRHAKWWPWVTKDGFDCRVFADELVTFRDGYQIKAERSDICINAEKNHEKFDDVQQAPLVRASAVEEWDTYARSPVRRIGSTAPRAVERPSIAPQARKIATDGGQ